MSDQDTTDNKPTVDTIPPHILRRYESQIAAFNGISNEEIKRRVFERWQADGFTI